MGRKSNNSNLKLVEKSFEDELLFFLKRMDPESLRQFELKVNTIFLEMLAESKSSKELIQHRPEIIEAARTRGAAGWDLLEKFDKVLAEKKRSEFKGIKGGADRRPQAEVDHG